MFHRLLTVVAAGLLMASCSDQIVSTESAAPASKQIGDQGGRPFMVALTGEAEVNGGDLDGSGVARLTLNPGQGEVCYYITVQDILAPSAAHIHDAPAGVNGPVVVPLIAGLDPGSDLEWSGCTENVDRALIRDILQNPSEYYVNVHNSDFPPGAVRGQLSK